jgi:hypothetical protein
MTRNAITEKYLAAIRRPVPVSPITEMMELFYKANMLPRPLLLERQEVARLHADVENLRSALISLPDKVFGGDVAAFARAVGMTEVQVEAILRSQGSTPTRLSRADLYLDEAGFRVLEYNMGSTLGGLDASDICANMLTDPELAAFAREHELTYADSFSEHLNTICAETGQARDSRPMIALTDWPSSFETLGPYVEVVARRWSTLGFDARACHIGELSVRDGRVWLRGQPVDVVNRLFMLEDLMESPQARDLMFPVLDAARRGEVTIFTPMDSELYASKGALALLSDEANRHLWTARERESLDRILPWTRMVRRGEVTLDTGERADLLDYAVEHQHELALKPVSLHGGIGVILGWLDETSPEEWRRQVTAAIDGPFVLQRRVRPVPELMPASDGELVPWIASWGMFTVDAGFGGLWIRAVPEDTKAGVINLNQGAAIGCALWTA